MNHPKKTALVTGAGRRLGREISLALARAGYDIVVNYFQSEGAAQKTADEIKGLGRRALTYGADVSNSDQVHGMVKRALDTFGQIDLLVNNAAIFSPIPFEKLTEAIWDKTLETNLKGTFLCSREIGGHMLHRRSGSIINIASLGGIHPWADEAPYCVSKAGVIMLTKCFAKSLAPHIRVNAIAPGYIDMPDPILEKVIPQPPLERVPLKRFGRPEEITDLVVYLATKGDYITGQVFSVDGGRSL
ncbi:MAG: 3-oxoacyl-ACP reductase FabG [Nitrospirae bacterium]|nr:3-oxoacyl-ACP reductase FabG [Nitrospirota bacterium]